TFEVVLDFRLINERSTHRIFRNFISSTEAPANRLVFHIQRSHSETTAELRTRRNHSGLFTLELLVTYAAENTEIALFTGCETIGTVHTIIAGRNLLFDCSKHANSAGANIRLNTPRLTILSGTGKIAG